jgi:hypothetical protein
MDVGAVLGSGATFAIKSASANLIDIVHLLGQQAGRNAPYAVYFQVVGDEIWFWPFMAAKIPGAGKAGASRKKHLFHKLEPWRHEVYATKNSMARRIVSSSRATQLWMQPNQPAVFRRITQGSVQSRQKLRITSISLSSISWVSPG